jgi:hypothetical protein
MNVSPPTPFSMEFHGHGWTVQDLAGLAGFWCAVFSESREIYERFGNEPDCPFRTEINGNLR